MSKQEKRMIGVLVLILIIVIAIGIVMSINKSKKNSNENQVGVAEGGAQNNAPAEEFVDVLEDGTKLNTSNKLKETKTFDGMEISKLQLTTNENVSVILGEIKNVSDTAKGGYPISITLIDKEGNEIITVKAYIKQLAAGETTELNVSANIDYANAYDFRISK